MNKTKKEKKIREEERGVSNYGCQEARLLPGPPMNLCPEKKMASLYEKHDSGPIVGGFMFICRVIYSNIR